MIEMNDVERLALAQALYNAIGGEVKTKDPHNLRGRVDEYYKGVYELHHGKSYDVQLNGQKVGTYSITVTKPKKGEELEEFELKDVDEFTDWLKSEERNLLLAFAFDHMADYAAWRFDETGEVPEGCTLIRYVTPDEPGGEISRTTLKVDPQAVAKAVGGNLEAAVTMLLEGGTDD